MCCWSFFAHSLHSINGISHLRCSQPSLASIDLLTQTLWSSSTFLLSVHRFLSCIAKAYHVQTQSPLSFSTGAHGRGLMISSDDDDDEWKRKIIKCEKRWSQTLYPHWLFIVIEINKARDRWWIVDTVDSTHLVNQRNKWLYDYCHSMMTCTQRQSVERRYRHGQVNWLCVFWRVHSVCSETRCRSTKQDENIRVRVCG